MRIRCWLLPTLFAGIVLRPCMGQESSLPPVPQGIEVLARGPVHEAFASLTTDPQPTKPVPRQPPKPIEELPPDEKPDGDVVWIGGYWAWDDERSDFLWVSGVWRKPPPGKQWVAGYWREEGDKWQWVPGFWAVETRSEQQQITYLPAPPAQPNVVPPGKPPSEDSFYVPGSWVWTGERYAWRAGYWARVQPGYVWVPAHYRWTPSGYIFVPGYWDLALKSRGILYAPVVIQPSVLTVGFTYTPAYAVRDTVVVDALFVRPAVCHYYFGDYYGPTYRRLGYESCIVYSRRHYDSIIVYECYERRRDPNWITFQINLYNDRCAGWAPRPPRTLVQQQKVINNTTVVNKTVVNNITMIAPTKQVAKTKNVNLVKLDSSTRQQAKQQAVALQQVTRQRSANEIASRPGTPRQARVASLKVPRAQPVSAKASSASIKNAPPRHAKPASSASAAQLARPVNPVKPASLGSPVPSAPKATSPVQPAGHWGPASPTKPRARVGQGQPPRRPVPPRKPVRRVPPGKKKQPVRP